eukprot:jgi/Chlat1/4450/Chrsp29S08887
MDAMAHPLAIPTHSLGDEEESPSPQPQPTSPPPASTDRPADDIFMRAGSPPPTTPSQQATNKPASPPTASAEPPPAAARPVLPPTRIPSDSNLEVSVSDPVKQGEGVQAYVSYRVTTKTNLPQYRWTQFNVIRRFSDFVWLHDRLVEKNPGVIIPPVPEKNVVGKLEAAHNLHPMLYLSTDLQLFLEASEEVWAVETARTEGALKKKPRDFLQLIKDVQQTVSGAVLGKERPERDVDPEYEAYKAYANALEGHLAEARRQAERLVKRHKELKQALGDFGVASVMLGGVEGGVVGHAFTQLGDKAHALSETLQKQASDLSFHFEQPLREYVRTVYAVKAAVPRREDRVQQAEHEAVEYTRKVQNAKEQYDMVVERMRMEMARFHMEMCQDLHQVLRDFAASQARLTKDMAAAWRSLLPELEKAKSETAGTAPVVEQTA